ncbi:MAG TPA: fumarylacetoacetate hydrolase family protein [Polyangia bacterium]|jgi:2-dehydro-3-deoxy-D-arabinonate dehydratase|nr:fumarylacetoacetate hydrolase family protein [Polyangia bacterium]
MLVYRTSSGVVVDEGAGFVSLPPSSLTWNAIFRAADPRATIKAALPGGQMTAGFTLHQALAPTENQEVWAAGVTYFRSRDARMEESQAAGGGDFYALVYEAERPELFFKSTPERVVGHGQPVRLRADARWNVPEPELVLAVNAGGRIFGYSVGNDMSSRDIEGENPLYLPQAKVYDGSCAVGPGLWLPPSPPGPETKINLSIVREGHPAFTGETSLAQLKRSPETLVGYLYRETTFPNGALLFTGTGIVPPNEFTLRPGDEIRIAISGIGTLVNVVAAPRA